MPEGSLDEGKCRVPTKVWTSNLQFPRANILW